MSLAKKQQPIPNNTQHSVTKPSHNISQMNLNKNQLHRPQQHQQTTPEIKDVSYVDVYRNRKIHFIYLSIIISIGLVGFTYLNNQHGKPPHSEVRTAIKKEVEKEPEVIYRDVTRDVSSISRSKPLQYHYNSKYYEEEVIRIRIKNETDIQLGNEYTRYSLERDAHRNSERSSGTFRWNDSEIYHKHDKNKLRIRAERDRKLCELLQDQVHCAHWDNFKKVSDQLL